MPPRLRGVPVRESQSADALREFARSTHIGSCKKLFILYRRCIYSFQAGTRGPIPASNYMNGPVHRYVSRFESLAGMTETVYRALVIIRVELLWISFVSLNYLADKVFSLHDAKVAPCHIAYI